MTGGTKARAIVRRAAGDLRGAWRSLAATDIAYKAAAFAVLTPATTLLLRWFRSGTPSAKVVADIDIFWFFVTTPAGVATLVVGLSLIVAITALESACLMAIGAWRRAGRLSTLEAPSRSEQRTRARCSASPLAW